MAIAATEAAQKTEELSEGALTPKVSRHVSVALRHLQKQRELAMKVRDKADLEIKGLDAAILALG